MNNTTKEKTLYLIEYLEKYIYTLKDRLEKDLIYDVETDISSECGTIDLRYFGKINTITTGNVCDNIKISINYHEEFDIKKPRYLFKDI
jgi:hypothetical protein